MTPLKKIIYDCHKATFLIEKRQLGTITLREKLELRIHLAGCSVCRIFQQQSLLINQMMRSLFVAKANRQIHLDDSFKTELQRKIEEKLNES